MVKRPKSPDVVEDARYFTVCQPFPLNANWVFDDDQQDCATWVAECIGPEHLYAIHYKPSARGMILLEVSKMFTDHERLLGEHRWSELLKEPNDEEEKRVSRVFHSFYSKGREAQKDGWKNLAVKSTWFKRDWSPGKGRFKQPYPQTHWCPIPIEDKTGKQLCRPLPVDKIAPPPIRVEQPVVGSVTWNEKKNTPKPTAASLTKAWDGETSSTNVVNKVGEPVQPKPNAGSSVPKSPVATSPTLSTAGVATAVPNKSQPNFNSAPSRKNKKQKAIPLNQFVAGEGGGKTSKKPYTILNTSSSPVIKLPFDEPLSKSTPRSANAWDTPIQFPVSPAPAVAVTKEAPSEDLSSWGKEAAIPTIDQEKIWSSPLPNSKKKKGKGTATATTIPASVTSQGNKTQPSLPPRAVPNFRPSPDEEEEDSDDDNDIYTALSKMKYTEIDDLAPEELEHAHINAWEKGEDDNNTGDTAEPKSQTSKEEDPAKAKKENRAYGNLWLSEEDPRAIPPPKLICPTHRIACKKGICEDMTKLLRAEKRKELEAKWEEEEKNKKKGKKKKDAAKSGSGDNKDDDDTESKTATSTAEVDGDNFAIVRPRGTNRRDRFGKHKKAQDGSQVKEPSHIGRMRAFPDGDDDNAPSDHADGEAAAAVAAAPGAWNYVAETVDQW